MLEDILFDKQRFFESGMQTVLRGQENRVRRVVLQQGNLIANERSEVNGVCARVYKNGVNGFASMADYSGAAAEMVLKAATENAEYLYKYAKTRKPALQRSCPPATWLRPHWKQVDSRTASQEAVPKLLGGPFH